MHQDEIAQTNTAIADPTTTEATVGSVRYMDNENDQYVGLLQQETVDDQA